MSKVKYDFSGWATKNDLKCADGKTIRRNAFIENDGQTVPLVWQHQHDSPENVLGHVLLENRKDGVYAYGKFNDTELGQLGKQLVANGDVKSLSIYANKLKQDSMHNVLHGMIREVSLVLAGANPGATIDYPILAHGDDSYEQNFDEATIYSGEGLYLMHSDDTDYEDDEEDETMYDDMSVEEVLDTFDDDQLALVDYLVDCALGNADPDEDDPIYHDGLDEDVDLDDIYDSLNEDQVNVLEAIVGAALEAGDDAEDEDYDDENDDYDEDEDEDYEDDEDIDDIEDDYDDDESVEHSYYEGGEEMNHNVFENDEAQDDTLMHDAMETIIADGKRFGSIKESFLQHAAEYGIENIDYLFPEAHNLNNPPEFIKQNQTWVQKVMAGVHHTPFSRIKSTFADITEDEARARGYLKGKLKKEEVFTLLKRTTNPTTVYKKQKMDRDDVVDITDFDVIAWLKTEMRMKLNEELARAYLFGDGRDTSSDDKINETCIRPIATDADLFTVTKEVTPVTDAGGNVDTEATAKAVIRAAIKARKDYKGSGNPTLYTTEDMLSDMLLLEDGIGHALYANEQALATKMRVKEIVTVPDEIVPNNVYGLIVNLNDYNVGADKGGAINMFDDFDIDYNQQKYLIETRCSGALTKPKSAIVLKKATD